MPEPAIRIYNLQKLYNLGEYRTKTLTSDLSRWWSKKRGKVDPNAIIGAKDTRFWALKGFNAEIQQGEAVGIIGRNGSGKSTLLKILARITAPTNGKVVMQGTVASMLEIGTGFHPEMTGRENIFLNGSILGMSRDEVRAKLDDIIAFSECAEFIDTPVKRYSSGMYVKLAFSVAAHLDSDIVLMDEVLAVGDMNFQQKCLDKMNRVVHDEQRTVIFVSHNMESVKQLCSRCLVLDCGQCIYDGETEMAISVYYSTLRPEKTKVPEKEAPSAAEPSPAAGTPDGQTPGPSQQNSETVPAMQAAIDLATASRPFLSKHSARLLQVQFIGPQSGEYAVDEPVVMDVKWGATAPLSAVCVRITLYQQYKPVGVALSQPLTIDGDSTRTDRFTLDLSGIVPGVYQLIFCISEVVERGTIDVDIAEKIVEVTITPNPAFPMVSSWPYDAWGHALFPLIKQGPPYGQGASLR